MREPTVPPGTRIFGRVDRFVVECPICGQLLFAHTSPTTAAFMRESKAGRARLRRGFKRGSPYNPFSSRLRCPSCGTVYGVGLLLWPAARSGGAVALKQPADQHATARQMAEMRRQAVSIWVEGADKKLGEDMNQYVPAECTCPEVDGGWAPGCPIHGEKRGSEG